RAQELQYRGRPAAQHVPRNNGLATVDDAGNLVRGAPASPWSAGLPRPPETARALQNGLCGFLLMLLWGTSSEQVEKRLQTHCVTMEHSGDDTPLLGHSVELGQSLVESATPLFGEFIGQNSIRERLAQF